MDLKKIENFIDKQKVSFICSIDDENCPNVKAMLKPRKRIGLKEFYFSTKISSHLSKPEKKFMADITYGILASRCCLLTDIVDQLHEPSQKINIVDRLSRHLEKSTPASAAASYLTKW